jgi:hypothetical protein
MSIEKYRLHKVTEMPATVESNSIYYVSAVSSSLFSTYITDKNGGIRSGSASSTSGSVDKTELMGVTVHGSVSGSARPSGFSVVTWIGSVEPVNAIDNDIWYNNNL